MAKQSSNYADILGDLKNKNYKPVYFLSGEEPYYIDLISDYIQDNVLTESEKAFDQFIMYAQDYDLATILEQARHFPMCAPYQVIIVKEAQKWTDFEELSSYLKAIQPQTILVICHKYKKVDRRKKWVSEFEKVGVLFESEKIKEDKVPTFIINYLKTKGATIEEKATMMMVSHLGNNLQVITDELDKLIIALGSADKRVTADLVENNVGISKEFNIFELVNAFAYKDVYKVYFISNNMVKRKDFAFQPNIAMLFRFFSNLMIYHYIKTQPDDYVARELGVSPYFLRDYKTAVSHYNGWKTMEIISLLREYDMKSKGYMSGKTSHEDELFKELIFKILH